MNIYSTIPLTVDEQIDLLEKRGLIIEDRERTTRHLNNIGYFRLSAYMHPYRQVDSEGIILPEFISGTTWSQVYDTYLFDRKLRLLVFDSIERIEVALRAQLVSQLSLKYGSHWHDKKEIFGPPLPKRLDIYERIQEHIISLRKNPKKEMYIKKYYEEYSSPNTPPCWMIAESLYFNQLTSICEQLKEREAKTMIASYFHLPANKFLSWLRAINYVRNLCAHHSRLWNRVLQVQPAVLKKGGATKGKVWLEEEHRYNISELSYFLCIINYMLQTVNPNSHFVEKLIVLLSSYQHVISVSDMGFPSNWKDEKMWKK